MSEKMTKEARRQALKEIKKQAMAQKVVSDASTQVSLDDPNYADKVMDLILDGVVNDIINDDE